MSVSISQTTVFEDEGFLRDLKTTLSLADDVLLALAEAARAGEGVDDEVLDEVAKQHGCSHKEIQAAGQVVGFLRWANLPPVSDPPVLESLKTTVAEDADLAQLLESKLEVITRVLEIGDEERLREYRRRAETSFMPCLTSFSGTWEIRPVLDDDDNTVDFVPVMVMKLESAGMLEEDFIVQITEKKFTKLREQIDKMDNALGEMRATIDILRAHALKPEQPDPPVVS